MMTLISQSELDHLSDLELRNKFNEVAKRLDEQQNETIVKNHRLFLNCIL